MENLNNSSSKSFVLTDNEINSLWSDIKISFQPDKPTVISNTIKNTIDSYIKYTYGEAELSVSQRHQLVEVVSYNLEKNINTAKAQYYANQAAKYKSDNEAEYSKAIENQNAYQQMAMDSAQKAIDSLNNLTSTGFLPKNLGIQALDKLEPILENICDKAKPSYIPNDNVDCYGFTDGLKGLGSTLGSLAKIAKMAKALSSNDANEIARTGVSMLGSMAAAAAVGALAGAAGITTGAAAAAACAGVAAGLALNWAWDHFDMGERLGLDPDNPAFDPFFGWVYDKTGWNGNLPSLDDWLHLNRDGKYHLYDPIVLDLDGDGIETVAPGDFNGTMFDHDNSGIKTATGWVKPDDGFLVVDRNGDGIINDGSELFGDGTILADGSKATNGYQALREFDSNGDGIINAEDANFGQLRIWRDLNQDGISQANELFTLKEAGIKSLKLSYEDTNTPLGNGNILAQKGSYETIDGTERTMGDLNFMYDSLYSKFTDHIKLDSKQMQAANLKGIGRVRDLREAAALSKDLASVLQAYSEAETKEEQLKLLDLLIMEWAKTDPTFDVNKSISLGQTWSITNGEGSALRPSQIGHGVHKPNQKWNAEFQALTKTVNILNTFTGQNSSVFYAMTETDQQNLLNAIKTSYNNMAQGIYQGLLFQTRLKLYITQIDCIKQDNQYIADYSAVTAQFDKVFQGNPLKAFIDLTELLSYKPEIRNEWIEGTALLEKYLNYAELNHLTTNWLQYLDQEALVKSGLLLGSNNNDIINGTNNNDLLFGSEGDDTLNGGYGDDILNGGNGDDILNGGNGFDILNGGAGNDILNGGNWHKDRYIFQRGHGQDTINDLGYDNLAERNDVVFEGANLADAIFSRSGFDLIIRAYGSDDSVKLTNYFNYNTSSRSFNFIFDDKTITYEDLIKDGYIFTESGDANDNTIHGWNGKDILNGGAGNDILWGRDGDDILNGDEGNDVLNGDNGNDILNGGDGDDTLNGGYGDDILNGGNGDDILNGGNGFDILNGGAGNDILNGGNWHKDQYIFQRGHGQDTINDLGYDNLAERNDVVFEGANLADAIFSRSGFDLIIRAYGSDDSVKLTNYFNYNTSSRSFNFIFDDKTITYEDLIKDGYIFTESGDANDNTIHGWNGKDILNGGAGNDILWGRDGDDILNGDEGNDVLNGDNGNDILNGGDGDDTLNGGYGDDILNGGNGDDILNGGNGFDILNGGAGNDILNGGNWHKDRYIFQRGHGQDTINDLGYDNLAERNDVVFEGANLADAIFSRSGFDLIIRAYGSDDSVKLTNYFNYNTSSRSFNFIFDDKTITYEDLIKDGYIFTESGDANDNTIHGWNGKDILNGGAGNDILWGRDGDDILNGDEGNDVLNGDNGNDILNGGDGDDTLNGGYGDDILNGGNGDDILNGGNGFDILNGGAGNDILNGGNWHKDQYIFQRGHGQDTINDLGYDNLAERNDVVFEGANLADAIFSRSGFDLIIRAYGSDDSVKLTNYFNYNTSSRSFNFIFDDKTITYEDLIKDGYIFTESGDANDNTIHGWNGKDILNGGAGNDILWGRDGDDILNGDEGNDVLNGDNGNDILNGGDGDDTLNGGYGDDILNGGNGDDILNGGNGFDILNGGAGNDILNGGNWHKDQYIFQRGHGQDTINDLGYDNLAERNDVVFEGANLADAIFSRSGFDLIIRAYGSDDSVKLTNYFNYNTSSRSFNFIFDDKTITYEDLIKDGYIFTESGDANDNTIHGWNGKDILNGGAGNDILWGRDGDDILNGDEGNDVLNGDNGNDILNGGDGDDTLNGGYGDDILNGGNGDDILNGGNGFDILNGGAGNDILNGGNWHKDQYIFQRGHGQDTINDLGYDNLAERNDVVFEGANLADAIFSRSGFDLIIRAYGSDDSVKLTNYFNYNTSSRSFNFIFDDKTITYEDLIKDGYIFTESGDANDNTIHGWNGKDILNGGAGNDILWGRDGDDILNGDEGNDVLNGDNGNDILNGGDGDDTLNGGYGDDILNGGNGDDILNGGNGFDILNGGAGNDILNGGNWHKDQYIFQRGHGQDTINDLGYDNLAERNDVVFEGANLADAIFSRSGFDLIIRAYGSDDSVKLTNYFNYNTSSRSFNFIFDDKTITYEDLIKDGYIFTESGDANDNTIHGWNGKDILNGGAGNDILWGRDGDDILNGDEGNDVLNGDNGNDILNGGDGDDTLNGGYGDDILNGGNGDDILNGGNGFDILNGGAGNDILNGGNWHKDQYIFQRGHGQDTINDLGYDNLAERNDVVFEGANLADAIFSRSGFDLIIRAYGSDDSVKLTNYFNYNTSSRSFNFIFDDKTITYEDLIKDGYIFTESGDANDNTIHGWNGKDILNGGAGNDILWGRDGDDILNGDEGNDVLNGDNGNDILNGGDGDDTLNGGYGDDILNGGNGDDILNGGNGFDILNGGAGNDILNGGNWHKDQYIFQRGHGQDTINDLGYDNLAERNDVVFEGANLADAIFSRSGFDLIIRAYGSDDSVKLTNYFNYNTSSRSFNFIFDDKTITYENMKNIEISYPSYHNIPFANHEVASQAQQLVSAISAFSTTQESALFNSEQVQQFGQQNTVATYWGN